MKYFTALLIALIFIGCISKNEPLEKSSHKVASTTMNEKVYSDTEVLALEKPVEVEVEEERVVVNIRAGIPIRCGAWSDGCNSCTRVSSTQASCTKNPCSQNKKIFSCLKWN